MKPQPNGEEEKSAGRKLVERQIRQGNKFKKKLAKKAGKLALKLLKQAAMKFISILGQLLAWLVGAIGLPAVLIGLGVIVVFVIVSLAWTFFMGTGQGLQGIDKANYEYIVAEAISTVNMNNAIERPYRVPEKLIAATVQLSVFQESDKDFKSIVQKMASDLAPNFTYGKYDEWSEKQVRVCQDNQCTTGNVQHTDNLVTKIKEVNYWNGSDTFIYTPNVTPWQSTTQMTYKQVTTKTTVPEKYIETQTQTYTEYASQQVTETTKVPYTVTTYVKTIDENGNIHLTPVTETQYKEVTMTTTKKVPVQKTREVQVQKIKNVEVENTKTIKITTTTKTRKQYFVSSKTSITDYSTFDNILNSYGLSLDDKKLIEVNYLFLGGTIDYTDWLQSNGGGDFGSLSGFDGTIIPGTGVPPQFMPYYLGAQKKFGVDWNVLAAIHFVETGFSTARPMISSVGAMGPMQFMPATWDGWIYNIGGGFVSSSLDMSSLAVITAGHGAGQDGDGDGKADIMDNADAIYTAAYYLKESGYSKDPRGAIFSYNHADWYVNKVLSYVTKFKNEATYKPSGDAPPSQPGGFIRPTTGVITSPFGLRNFHGTFHYGIDIANPTPNTPIVAAADGVVTRSDLSPSYGNVVILKHNIGGQPYATLYAHMQNRAVAVGETVKQGQFLGYMGKTGDATGVHLHFELHKGEYKSDRSNAIDPALMIKF